jgi:hypothetical protein
MLSITDYTDTVIDKKDEAVGLKTSRDSIELAKCLNQRRIH